jgi:hypothetical protein
MTISSFRENEGKEEKLSLCLSAYHSVKVYGGNGCTATGMLNLVADGGEWSFSLLVRFASVDDSLYLVERQLDAVEEAFLTPQGIEHRFLHRPASIIILITKYLASITNRKINSFILCNLRR